MFKPSLEEAKNFAIIFSKYFENKTELATNVSTPYIHIHNILKASSVDHGEILNI